MKAPLTEVSKPRNRSMPLSVNVPLAMRRSDLRIGGVDLCSERRPWSVSCNLPASKFLFRHEHS
jgi:hypothetical protein